MKTFCPRLASVFSVANNGRSSVGRKKNLEITKMTDNLPQKKKRILKLPKLKDLFFF